jgi:hypothetical protein
MWGLIGNHERRVCEPYYHALYACTIPTVRSLLLPTQSFQAHDLVIDAVLTK